MKLVIQNAAHVWGGNEKWMTLLAEGLTVRGHEVVVSCRAGGVVARRLEERGIRTAPVRPGAYLDLARAVRFALWLRRERPDALLLTSWKETFWGAWAARRVGVPRVVVRLGIVRTPRRGRYAAPFRRWVDAMIVNSREIRDAWLAAAAWFPPGAVHVVLNGIRPAAMDRAAARARLRAEVGAAASVLLVGGAGNLERRKGFDLLVDALALPGGAHFHAVIVGDGSEADALRARAERAGVAARVTLLGRRDDVAAVLAGCDAFALPSRNEGMANVMLEAMAAGTPVVAAAISGVREAIGADAGAPPAGWIFPADDAAALGGALGEVAASLRGDGAEAARRSNAALRRVRERFGVERMAAECEAILFAPAAKRASPDEGR